MPAEREKRIYSLNQLLSSVQRCIQSNFNAQYWIKAEISEIRQSGIASHTYMELIEKGSDGSIISKAKAIIWKYDLYKIMSKFDDAGLPKLKNGITILCLVNVDFSPIYGISLYIKDIDPNFALGEIAKLRKETIEKLQKNGLFDLNKQIELPSIIKRIALITSTSAAGRGDFMNHINESPYSKYLQIALYPAQMQGDATSDSVIAAVDKIHQNIDLFDVIVIIRGGGAVSELRAFDDYKLCEYIANVPIPVITGIGHDRDVSVLDMIVSISQKTPTAVADFLIRGIEEAFAKIDYFNEIIIDRSKRILLETDFRLTNIQNKIPKIAKTRLIKEERILSNIEQKIQYIAHKSINIATQNIDRNLNRITAIAKNRVQNEKVLTNQKTDFLKNKIKFILQKENLKMESFEQIIRISHPENILKKGFAIISNSDAIQSNAKNIKAGDKLKIYMQNHIIDATVDNNSKEDSITTLLSYENQ